MGDRLPFFRMFPADFEAKTPHLSLAEDGAYNRLLRLMWMSPGCMIPNNDEWIRRRLRVSKQEYDDTVRPLIDEFFQTENQMVYQKRLLEEHDRAESLRETRRIAGKKGGRPRKSPEINEKTGKQTESKRKANGKQNETILRAQNSEGSPLVFPPGEKHSAAKKSWLGLVEKLEPVIGRELAEEFATHRAEKRSPYTATGAARLAKKLAGFDQRVAQIAVITTMENGWSGVFPEKVEKKPLDGWGQPVDAQGVDAYQRWLDGKRKGKGKGEGQGQGDGEQG